MKKTILVFMMSALLTLLPFAFAEPNGGSVDEIGQERASATAAATANIEGGNVSEVNVSGTQITSRWGAFYGNVSGGVQLADASSNIFYEWTVSDVTGAVVYASNGTVSNWASVIAANDTVMPSYLRDTAADNYNNTFQNTGTFTSASLSIANVNYTTSWESGAQGSTLGTYALYEAASDSIIFAGNATDAHTGFKGEALDYQVLVPANGTVETYNFYLELP